MEKNTVRLKVANISDIGKNPARTKNEDYFGHYEGDYGNLFLVCDGMGGHEAGEIASRLAVDSIKTYFETNYIIGEELDTIRRSIDFAQQKILEQVRDNPSLESMGTTLVLLLIQGVSYWYAHSGDSRIYLSRGGSLHQLTVDHSEVQTLVESGIISPDQVATHPRRNFITKAVGHTSYLPDVAGPRILQQDDVFLLCTDGLTEYVKDDELLQQMEEEPAIACRNLVDIANERGGSDNITLQVVQVVQCSPFSVNQAVPVGKPKGLKLHFAIVATVLVFAGAVIWYVLSLKQDPTLDPPPIKPPKQTEVKKDKKTDAKETPVVNSITLEKAIDSKLGAVAASEKYQKYFDSISDKTKQAKNLKFISKPQSNQVVYIIPGQTVYLDYAKLGTVNGKNYSWDLIYAIIALAVVKSGETPALAEKTWETKLFESGSAAIDEGTYAKARDLYIKSNADKAATDGANLFSNDNRFGKFRKLLRIGTYNFGLAE